MAQMDLFNASSASARSALPDPEQVRHRLNRLLETLREAQVLPWTEDELAFHRTVVPQMANWLAEGEADAVRSEFRAHLERLNVA